jgi:uncharacterized protein (TIGR02145 family)
MKHLLLSFLLFTSLAAHSQVGIGTATPAASAQLDVSSTTKGFLPPRMDSTQRNAIVSPAAGLIIYNTTISALQIYSGSTWYTASAATTMGAIGGSSTTNGGTITSGVLSLTPADATNAGIVTTGTQTFAGNKIFNGNVGIGTATPPAKLSVIAGYSEPSIPGTSSAGVFRIGVTSNEGMDFGKSNTSPYSGWIQNGFGANTSDPLSLNPLGGNVGIGTMAPAASAQLDVNSTTKGFLPPRMMAAQRSAISSPTNGLLVFQTDYPTGLYYFNAGVWLKLSETTSYPNGTATPIQTICCQSWMTKNLDVATYRNGDPIPKVTDATAWGALTTGAYCYYNNDSATYAAIYGKLYNWYAVNDPRGLAPEGWHIPTDFDWTTLENCLGGASVAGGKMKTTGTTRWTTPNTGATNESGFAGLPGGYRNLIGSFSNVGNLGYWWSATESLTTYAWARNLFYNDGTLNRSAIIKTSGSSVRCLRD